MLLPQLIFISPQPWATDMAFRWIAGTHELASLCGWLTMCRLLRQGNKLMPRSEAELRDHATALSADAPLYLRKAVMQTLEEISPPQPLPIGRGVTVSD